MIVNYKMIFFKGGGVSLITGASDIYIPFKLSTSFKCIKKIRIDHGLGTITPVTRRKLREREQLAIISETEYKVAQSRVNRESLFQFLFEKNGILSYHRGVFSH